MKKIVLFGIFTLTCLGILSAVEESHLRIDEIRFVNSYKYRDMYFNLPLQTTIYITFVPYSVDTTTVKHENIKIYWVSDARGEIKDIEISSSAYSFQVMEDTIPFKTVKINVDLDYNNKYKLIITTNVVGISTAPALFPLDRQYEYIFYSVVSTTFTSYLLKEPSTSQPRSSDNIELLIKKDEFGPGEAYFASYLLTGTTEYQDKLPTLPKGCKLLNIAEFKAFSSTQPIKETKNLMELRGYGYYGYNVNCSFYYLDEDRVFRRINTFYDTNNDSLVSSVNKFGIYAVVEEPQFFDVVSNIRCYPVPWAPDSEKSDYGNYNEGIKFDNLPYDCVIEIYTLSGELVHRKEYCDLSGIYHWYGKNDKGENCASGVYLWQVKTDSAVKTGKLIIIR